MKTLIFIFSIAIYLFPANTQGNDHDLYTLADHEILINQYLAEESQYTDDVLGDLIQVILIDFDGNVIRQFEMEEGIEFNTPKILWPIIDKAHFLTEIHGIYYYLYQKNSVETKKNS